jgi:hypothetical protein
MKSYIFESVKELNDYLQARKGWKKPQIEWSFQVMDTFNKGNEKVYTIVDRFLVTER